MDLVKREGVFTELVKYRKNLRSQKTNRKIIKVREGKGGKSFKYVQRIDVMRWLDKNFPYWSWEVIPESFREFAKRVQVAGRLMVYVTESQVPIVITTYGSVEVYMSGDSPVERDYAKAADTDALKRAVFTLGGFSDVYSESEEIDDVSSELSEDIQRFMENVVPKLLVLISKEKISLDTYRKVYTSVLEGKKSTQDVTLFFEKLFNE